METPDADTALLNALGWILLAFSGLSIVLLITLGGRYPATRRRLTRKVAARSWSGRQTLVLMACFVGLGLALPFLQLIPGAGESAAAQFFIVLLYALLQITLLLIFRLKRAKAWSLEFGMSGRRLLLLPLSAAIYLATMPTIGIVSLVYQSLLERLFGLEVDIQSIAQLIADSTSWIKAGYVLLTVAAAPVYEEIIFRGVFFPYLVRKTGLLPGILVVSAVFALLHFHLPTLIPLFLLSTVLCLAYWRTGTLWISIGVHALFNGMTVLLLLLGY